MDVVAKLPVKEVDMMINREKLWEKTRINVVVILFFAGIMLIGLITMRKLLISNANSMSKLLLDNYASKEEDIMDTYENILIICTRYIEEKEAENASLEEIKSGLYPYLDGFADWYEGDTLRAIGIIDGYVISNEEEFENFDDGVYDYTDADWYQKTIEADGEVYISDAYDDYTTDKKVITISRKMENSNNILLFDVFFEEYHTGKDTLELPEDAAYYLCDGSGTVVYYQTGVYTFYDDIQEFANRVFEWSDGKLDGTYTNTYVDAKGKKRVALVKQLKSGWKLILTIPQKNAVGGMSVLYFVVGSIFLAGVVLVIFMMVRDFEREKDNQILWEGRIASEQEKKVYQKAMRSTLVSHREVCYIDLVADTYRVIYPESNSENRRGHFQEAIVRLFETGRLQSENAEEMKAFLSLDNIHKELKDKNYMEIRCKHTGLDGVTESCSLTITVVDRRDGEPVTATLTIRSIENMLRQEEAQRELLVLTAQRAEAANHAKSDFLSNMSHDIRTPMNAILGMTNIAVTHIDDKKRVMDALNKIRLSGKHLLGLINSVLDMSKIESGKLSLNEEAFNIREAAENLLNLVHSQIEEKSLELKVDAIQIEHENVTGDEQRLQQILINIIGNAIKFTPDGGRITLNLQEKISEVSDRGCYQFIIEDTGIGMESDFVNKIFEPFSRAADSRITHIEGSGLGMSIAINIARMMGGDIKVESELGKGSKVTVTVYLKTDYDRKTESEEGKEPEMAVFQNHDYSGKRVLLVEDNELNIEVAGELLTMVGFTVEYAYNGREAVDKVVKNPAGYYSMVFMDIQMPVMNGYEAAAAIRAEGRPDLKELAIVAMTADAFADDVKKAHEAGMNGHIAKPIDVSRLEQVIEKWIA